MVEVYKETPNYEPFAYYAVDDQRQIKAMLTGVIQIVKPGFLSSMSKRAVMMQAPIFDEIEALDFLLSEYSKIMKHKVVYSEVRNHYDPECISRTMLKNGFKYEDHLNIIVDLSQEEDVIFAQINSTRRKQIKRGYKRGAQLGIEYVNNMEIIWQCYDIIYSLYKRLGLLYPEKTFIYSAFRYATNYTYPICFYIKFGEQIIGTRIVLCYKNCIYDWYAGSLIDHYDKYPNDILPWEIFRWGHQNGFQIFDFGGAGKPNVHYGVRDYKKQFGGKLVNYGRYTLVHNPLKMKLAEAGFKIYQKVRLK
jgi:lipid II:glycine glycyltransferase (peptidoglycan interpeptide bridge formation enzyme)